MEQDYLDFFDYDDDGHVSTDEFIYGYLCAEYDYEQIFGNAENPRVTFKPSELAVLSLFYFLFDIFVDAITGGRRSRVGKRMRAGGYRKRRSGGGGLFSLLLTGMIVSGISKLWSHPRVQSGSCRRSFFKKQPAPSYRSVQQSRRDAAETDKATASEEYRGASSVPVPREEKAPHPIAPLSRAEAAAPSPAPPSHAEPSTAPKPRKSVPKKPSIVVPETLTDSGSWRTHCEDGAKYGLDPARYATEQDYLDALATAKFADRFRH